MDTGNQKLATKEQTSFTELLDHQEAIILDLENLHYYTLNAAATLLWNQLRAGTASTVDELSTALSVAFSINAEQAELDTRAYLDELTRYGLVSSATREAQELSRSASESIQKISLAYEPPQLKVSNSLSQVTLSGSATITGG